MDIGGTLSKVVYFAPDQPDNVNDAERVLKFITKNRSYGETGTRDEHFSYHVPVLRGTLHFIKFLTSRMNAFLQLVKSEGLVTQDVTHLTCTGGGAHKFEEEFHEILNISLRKVDEMDSLVQGAHFLIKTSSTQCFVLEKPNFSEEMTRVPTSLTSEEGSYLLVNIGSGVSILRVDGPNDYSRVGGSSLGGSTFLALTMLLTKAQSFQEALALAEEGDSTCVDMLVRDIYGSRHGYDALGLSPTVVASSFGKLINPEAPDQVSASDLAKAALIMITNNIGQLAHLHSRLENVSTVVFAGNFLENNEVAMRTLSFAMDFWSNNTTKAVFFENVGYSGAVGALTSNIGDALRYAIATPPTNRERRAKPSV